MPNGQTLVIGGTSGIGLDVANRRALSGPVIITGRNKRQAPDNLDFMRLELGDLKTVEASIASFAAMLPEIDCLVYAAGFYQEGELGSLGASDIGQMLSVGSFAPTLLINELLAQQGHLNQLVLIGSSSGYTPRPLEPVYCLTKAGYPILAKLLAAGGQVTTALAIEPSGTKTGFWRDYPGKVAADFLEPEWVGAQTILQLDAATANRKSFTHVRLMKAKGNIGPQVHIVE